MAESADQCSFTTRTNTILLDGLKRSDSSTWDQFISRYRPVLVGYARRVGLRDQDSEDVTQATLEAFYGAYREGHYDRDRGRLRDWLFGIARNQIRMWRRSQRAQEKYATTADGADLLAMIGDDQSMQHAWEEEWRAEVLQACLEEVRREVDAKTFEAFDLFAHQGWPAQKVGEHLGMTSNAVFIAKHRVLKRVRDLLPQFEEIW